MGGRGARASARLLPSCPLTLPARFWRRHEIIDHVGELDWSQEVVRRLQALGMGPGVYKPPGGKGPNPGVAQSKPEHRSTRAAEAKYVPLAAVDVADALPAADGHGSASVHVIPSELPAGAGNGTPSPLVVSTPEWLAGARVYRELHAKAVAAAAREASVGWWSGFVLDDGFDDRRLRAYRASMPGLLRMQRRTVEGLKKSASVWWCPVRSRASLTRSATLHWRVPSLLVGLVATGSVANALKKKAASSWTSYRGSMFAVGWRFVTAWKVYLLSLFYVVGAVWWLFYTVFVVSLGCLFTMGKIPACTSRRALCQKLLPSPPRGVSGGWVSSRDPRPTYARTHGTTPYSATAVLLGVLREPRENDPRRTQPHGCPKHARCAAPDCVVARVTSTQAVMLTGVTGWEVLVLLWAALMDTMPFIPIGAVEPPPADADDASYADPDVLTKSGRWVLDMTLVGRTRRWVRGRRRTCRRLCCDPRSHSTKTGNEAFSLRVQGKQAEVHSRFWTWINEREDVSHGVRRRSTVTAFHGLRRAYNGSPGQAQQPSDSRSAGEAGVRVSLPPVVDLPVFLPQRWWWSCIMRCVWCAGCGSRLPSVRARWAHIAGVATRFFAPTIWTCAACSWSV